MSPGWIDYCRKIVRVIGGSAVVAIVCLALGMTVHTRFHLSGRSSQIAGSPGPLHRRLRTVLLLLLLLLLLLECGEFHGGKTVREGKSRCPTAAVARLAVVIWGCSSHRSNARGTDELGLLLRMVVLDSLGLPLFLFVALVVVVVVGYYLMLMLILILILILRCVAGAVV